MSEHINTEGERVSIRRAGPGLFEGRALLVIHDDPRPAGTGIAAPMLLDAGTRAWLREEMDALDDEGMS